MQRKFASLCYVSARDEIPVRFKLLKKSPGPVFDWYIDKFNPFIIEDMEIAGESGLKVFLPLTNEDAGNNQIRAQVVFEKTLDALKDYNVEIIFPPRNLEIPRSKGVYVANGRFLRPFFLVKAIKKAVSLIGVDLKHAETVIINGDYEMTECIIDNILYDVNFLTVIDNNNDLDKLQEKAGEVFGESGLNIQLTENNKSFLKNADIVINTSDRLEKYDFAFRKNSVYFEFSEKKESFSEILSRRTDMLVVDNFQVGNKTSLMPLWVLEMAMYTKCRDYRLMLSLGYSRKNCAGIQAAIRALDIRPVLKLPHTIF